MIKRNKRKQKKIYQRLNSSLARKDKEELKGNSDLKTLQCRRKRKEAKGKK